MTSRKVEEYLKSLEWGQAPRLEDFWACFNDRKAECGACGTERVVTNFMKRDFDQQFLARPDDATDRFYCGCQDDDPFDF